MIGLVAAMPSELKAITDHMTGTAEATVAGVQFITGKLEGIDTVAALSGVGKVAAALCATLICYIYKPEALIHVGVAGGLKEEQNVADLVISDEIFQADFDTTPLDGPEGLGKTFYTDAKLSEMAIKTAKELEMPWFVGAVASQDKFMYRAQDYAALMKNFPTSICSEMEGGAVAQVAAAFEVPFLVLRTLSDIVVHEDNPVEFSKFEVIAAKQAGDFIDALFRTMKEEKYA